MIPLANYHSLTSTGTDLSPIQNHWYEYTSTILVCLAKSLRVPANCHFEVDDFESEWEFKKPFDFIHARNLGGSTRDFPLLLSRIKDNLNNGGWVELTDFVAESFSDDGSMERAPNIAEWTKLIDVASTKFGKKLSVAPFYKKWVIEAGFQNVKEEVYKVCKPSTAVYITR